MPPLRAWAWSLLNCVTVSSAGLKDPQGGPCLSYCRVCSAQWELSEAGASFSSPGGTSAGGDPVGQPPVPHLP